MTKDTGGTGKEEPQRGPYQDRAFIAKYVIDYRTREIESFDGVLENLQEDYDVLLSKRDLTASELLRVVKEKTKELQQCEDNCAEEYREIRAYFDEKAAANKAIRDKAEGDLREYRERLEATVRNVEERTAKLQYCQEYAQEGQKKLEQEIETLTEEIEKARKRSQQDCDFINKLWEHFRSYYVKNESENLNNIKRKYLDAAIQGLSHSENIVIREKFRLKHEMRQQTGKLMEQKNEYKQQEKALEVYRAHLYELRKKFYNLVPVPEWTCRMSAGNDVSGVCYVSHEERDLCEHENAFRVPLSVETLWTNYKNAEADDRKPFGSNSSVIANAEEERSDVRTMWTFDKKCVVRAAHG